MLSRTRYVVARGPVSSAHTSPCNEKPPGTRAKDIHIPYAHSLWYGVQQQEQYSEGGTDKEEVIDATLGELGRSQASSANIGGPVERADPCLQGQASTVIGGRRVSESTEDCARTLVSRLHASGTTSGNAESPYNTRQGDSALIAESGNLATSPPGETTIIYPAELQHDMTSLDGPPLRKGGAASRSKQDKNTGSLSAVPKYTAKYRCGTCGKVFNQSGNLNRHRVVHTRERPFKCTICGKGFSQKSHVRTHQTVHTGVKAFQCNYCPKRFSQLGHLNGHIERHRRVGEIAPFDNDIYGASSKNMPYSDPTTPLVQNSSQLTTPPACNALVVVHAIAPLPTADLQAPGLDRINDLELQSNDLVPGTGPRGAASTAPKLALATLNHAPPGTDARSVAADEGIATDHTSSPFKISSSPSTSDSDSGRDSNGS